MKDILSTALTVLTKMLVGGNSGHNIRTQKRNKLDRQIGNTLGGP